MELQLQSKPTENPVAPLRLDDWMRNLTKDQPTRTLPPPHPKGPQTLPEPVFPRHPELLGDASNEPVVQERHWTAALIRRKLRCWLVPYVKSRVLPGELHPIAAYLMTDYKCNVDCNYCPSWNNRTPGMTDDIARRSIDWLRSTTCRILAVMGGEPLVRPKFVHKVVDYASSKGFWVYIGTNGRLLTPDLIDRLGDAGIAVFNLAVDVMDEKPGLPKALNAIRPAFEDLVRKQYRYGYMVFFNICICRNNLEDVKQLTELAHEYRLATDYHICESPMYAHDNFRHLDDNPTFVRPEDWPRVDDLVDWLIEKQRSGYQMVNSVKRLQDMKAFMRGKVEPWNCRAGKNSIIIRTDGTLGPCSPFYGASYPWGHIEKPMFDQKQLDEMKVDCQRNCFSTLNHNLGFCYNDRRVARFVLGQALHGFRGHARSFDE
jgi:MoaA/NifB/PqqE/SkfB family radical SAM enzyme